MAALRSLALACGVAVLFASAAAADPDVTPPTTVISAPADGASLTRGLPVTISGSAADDVGTVTLVEVSLDGGATWQPATGTTAWTFHWSPLVSGSVTIESRATDDSGNTGVPGLGGPPTDVVNVTVVTPPVPSCPCTVFQPSDAPVNPASADGPSIELGMKFVTTYDGWIYGVRFYKGFANTGTHRGHLWTRDGTLLAEVTFANESAFGWQTAVFSTPIPVTLGTTYVVSVHSPLYYPYTHTYFVNGRNSGPLRGLANGEDGPNGVYKYTSSPAFPTDTYDATNYWVDAVFDVLAPGEHAPPVVQSVSPADGATGVARTASVSATFDAALDPATVNGSTFTLTGPGAVAVPATVSWSSGTLTATLVPSSPLAYATTYTARLAGGASSPRLQDLEGNSIASDQTWTFTTLDPPPPPVISALVATPSGDGSSATITWTTDIPATTQVDWGTTPALGTTNSSAALFTAHTVTLTGLANETTYHYRVTSANAAGFTSTEPAAPADPATFTTPPVPCALDRLASEFALGDLSGGAYVSQMADGEVMLPPGRASEFDAMPGLPDWQSFQYIPAAVLTVSGGVLTLDMARLNTEPLPGYGPGTSVEFVATFGTSPNQYIGFGAGNDLPPGDIYNTPPAAVFGTGTGGAVITRTWTGSFSDFTIPGSLVGTPHRYRIDWTATGFDYWVDGLLVRHDAIAVAGPMRVAASDDDPGVTMLTLDWIHVSPYPASGTFLSRVHDGGGSTAWGAMRWAADVPAGTSLAMSVRRGDTPVPDGTWTAFQAVAASGDAIGGVSRYLQYRADLASTASTLTPVLRDVAIACTPCTDPVPNAIANLAVTAATSGSGGRVPVTVTFSVPSGATSVEVWRAPYGGYPRYDDAGGATPATPSYPPGAPWTLTAVTTSGQADDPPTRDQWHYVAFARGTCFTSAVSNRPAGVLNYLLGDVADGVATCSGDSRVNIVDLTVLGGHYGATLVGDEAWACADVGPTTNRSVRSRPTTDGVLNFEDLVLFAINFTFDTAAPPARAVNLVAAAADAVTLRAPASVRAGETFDAEVVLSGTGRIHALSAVLTWDATAVVPVDAGGGPMLEDQEGFAATPHPGQVDVAVLGAGRPGLTGEGVVARVTFRALADGDPGVALGPVTARDGENADVALTGTAGVVPPPSHTGLEAVAPNPARGSATLAFALAESGPVDLSIYSVDGRRVANLVHESRGPGRYQVAWGGARDDGAPAPPGMYYARLATARGQWTRTLILIR